MPAISPEKSSFPVEFQYPPHNIDRDVDSFREHEFSSQSLNSVPHFPSPQTKNPTFFLSLPIHFHPSPSRIVYSTPPFPFLYRILNLPKQNKTTKLAIRTPGTKGSQPGLERTNSARNPWKLSYTNSPTSSGNRAQRYLGLVRTGKIGPRSCIRIHYQRWTIQRLPMRARPVER